MRKTFGSKLHACARNINAPKEVVSSDAVHAAVVENGLMRNGYEWNIGVCDCDVTSRTQWHTIYTTHTKDH